MAAPSSRPFPPFRRSGSGPGPPSPRSERFPVDPSLFPFPARGPDRRPGMSRKDREGAELEAGAGPIVAGFGRDEPQDEDADSPLPPWGPVLPLTCGSVFGPRTEPVPGAEAALDAPSSRYFASLDASVGDLQHRAQHLIDNVNSSRKEDHNVMSTFRDSLLLKVSGLAEQLEERLFHLYGIHNELIQERLQELAEVMERVGEAEAELRQVCRTVEAAYRDLCLQPES
ncbi:synaptonemal complex central element protein 2 [Ara ararauna]